MRIDRLFLGLVTLALAAHGQSTANARATPDPYAAEGLVLVRDVNIYQMNADGTGTQTQTLVSRIQSEAVLRQLGVLTISYAANSQRVEFANVRVRHPDGTVTETPGTEAVDAMPPITRKAPFYSDLKLKQLPVRGMRVGDTLEWEARIKIIRAEATNHFWNVSSFERDAVVLDQQLELRVPKDKYVQTWSPAFKPVETTEGNLRIFRWKSSQLKPTVGPAADAEKESKKKHVLTAAEELDHTHGKLPEVAWTTFKSWEEVGAWYRGVEGERTQPDAAVKAKVGELTAGKPTDEDRVKAVYVFVATQLRYIGVAFGIGRYQPHTATEVLDNQYGDCKDKHTLLAAMLVALGFKPEAVLIGAGIRFNEALPSPAAFNHLITRVMVAGRPVWLDTTAEVAPYEVLLSDLRDHTALVIPDAGPAHLDRTPAHLPFAAFHTMEAKGSLDEDGTSNSKMTFTVRGDDEVQIRAIMRQIQPAQYDELIQGMSRGMGFGGTVTHAEISRAEDTDQPLVIRYDYKREKVGDWDNLRTIAQVAPISMPRPDKKDPPVSTLDLGLLRTETSRSEMKLPEGWTAELPPAIHTKSDYATLDQTYRFDHGTLYSERKLVVLREKVPVAEWTAYSRWAEQGDIGNEAYVQLIRHGAGKQSSVTPEAETATGDPGTQATGLITSAYNSISRHLLDEANQQLDKAKALAPEKARLWSTYGYLAFQRRHWDEAIVDYNKELALHPDNYGVYQSIAESWVNLHKLQRAEEALRKWQSLDAKTPIPGAMLTEILLQDGDPAGAVTAATSTLSLLDKTDRRTEALTLLLGKAELKSGAGVRGDATLTALLHSTDNPGILNGAAYALADAGLELPLAESSARKALTTMEDESRTWTLDESPQMLASKSRLIAATWDTVGWILFKEGKKPEAVSLLQAAWLNRQSSDVGEHLAEVHLAQGDRNAALSAITLAIPAATPPEMIRLVERAMGLRTAGAKTSIFDATVARQKLRTVSLGPALGLDGTAEYRILLSADKVEKVLAIGDKRLAGADDRLLHATFPAWVPTGSKAFVVKTGYFTCHSGTCEMVFQP